jgi:hypothetical protein
MLGMKRLLCSISLLWLALLTVSAVEVAAQTPRRAGSDEEAARRREEAARRESVRLLGELSRAAERGRRTSHEPPDDRFFDKKLTDAHKRLLAALPEDQAAYREFLRQAHTGLVRLLPRGKYEFTTTVAADKDPDMVLPLRGGGAFYSFIEKKQSYGPWSEITLQEGRLIVGFLHQSLGVMARLGDLPLDSLTIKTPGIDYLAQLAPPAEALAARDQSIRNFHGFNAGNCVYNANLPAIVNQTYVLRSTIYKKEGRMVVPPGGGAVYVPHPYEYGGADELIVFRILRAGPDGSITILWKRLQKFASPRIKQK